MRILMISDVYFPRINGVSTSIMTFRRELRHKGHTVTLLAPDYDREKTAAEDDIIRVPSRHLILDPEDRMMKKRDIYRLVDNLRSRNFDLIHIQTPFVAHYAGMKLSQILGVPKIESYHTFFEEYLYHYVPFLPTTWMRYAARRFTRAQCNDVDGLVVPSTAMLDVLRDYGVRAPAAVIPTGIEDGCFQGGDGIAFRRLHGISDSRPTLVHVGRIAYEKNIDFLLKVVARLRQDIVDVLLVIAGEGPALRHLKRLAHHMGLGGNVLFVGYLARDSALLDCYRAGDAFLFASRTETQGLVLLEAMALGVPVVSTAVMGTNDIVGPERGAIKAPDDLEGFSEKVRQLLGDPALRSRLGAEAIAFARTWSAPALAGRLAEFYREAAARCA